MAAPRSDSDSPQAVPFTIRLSELLSRLEVQWKCDAKLEELLSDDDLQLWRPLLQADYEQYWCHDQAIPVEQYLTSRAELLNRLGLQNDTELLFELVETEIQHTESTGCDRHPRRVIRRLVF